MDAIFQIFFVLGLPTPASVSSVDFPWDPEELHIACYLCVIIFTSMTHILLLISFLHLYFFNIESRLPTLSLRLLIELLRPGN